MRSQSCSLCCLLLLAEGRTQESRPDLAASRPAGEQRKAAVRKKVAIVVHEGVELLDFAGPGEVFAAARVPGSGAAYEVFLVAPGKELVLSQRFVRIQPEYDVATCPKPDIVVVPGGDTRQLLNDARFMAWIGETAKSAELMMSVCTGAFVLARAGLLEGKTATTHHGSIARLREKHPGVQVLENVRFVDHGKVLTSAGVSAGIDGALQVVRRQLGEEVARQTARYMEYRWEPEPAPATR